MNDKKNEPLEIGLGACAVFDNLGCSLFLAADYTIFLANAAMVQSLKGG